MIDLFMIGLLDQLIIDDDGRRLKVDRWFKIDGFRSFGKRLGTPLGGI